MHRQKYIWKISPNFKAKLVWVRHWVPQITFFFIGVPQAKKDWETLDKSDYTKAHASICAAHFQDSAFQMHSGLYCEK